MIVILLVSLHTFGYVVQKGDTLASIVRKLYTVPPYGKDGGVVQLIKLNEAVIKDPNHVPPGTVLRLNKKLLKKGVVDNNDGTQEDAETDEDVADDSAAGLNPYIEVEKYDAAKPLKERFDDKISAFVKFNFNNFDATERSTQAKVNFTTSSDTNVGLEYVKAVTDNLSLLAMAMLSQYAAPHNTTVVPNLDEAEIAQGAYTLGLRYMFMPESIMDFTVNYHPHYYLLTNPNTGNLILDNTLSPSIGIAMQNFFYNRSEVSLGIDLGFEFITNTKDSGRGSTNSSAYTAGLIYRQTFKSSDYVSIGFSFKDASTDTVSYSLDNRTFALSFKYSIPY